MQFRRHIPPLEEWRWRLPTARLQGRSAQRWALYIVGAVLAGYFSAYLILFPTPLLHGRDLVPRVVGLTLAEATDAVKKAGLQVQDGGSESDPALPRGVVTWQDPPGGVNAPAGLRVTLVSSDGPSKIPVPDVSGLEGSLAQRLVAAAGLAPSPAESVQAAAPPGVTMLSRPPAGALLAPGGAVTVVVSRGAPTITVPDLLGMSQADARTRIELEGLQLGTVTRRRTAGANPGTVVAQQPVAGSLAAAGTVVDIVVARSPQ
jgi:serine/threonine-protein kinase